MRKTRVSQLRFTAICRALAICAAYFAVTGCNDDTFDQFKNGKDATLAFQVSVPEKWTDGKSRAEAIEDVSIVKLDSDCEEQLYLITAVSSVPDSVVEMPASRGAVISEENFYSGFGLSAICYTGSQDDFDASGWTTNFARNIKMTKSNDFWQPTDNKLEWMGSGRVRFYAYAPYGADVKSDQGSLGLLGDADADVKGTPELDFVLADDVKKQVDLLTAIADCDGSQGGNVTLNFRHALTAVTVKTGDNMLAGTVKEVSFSNIQSQGRYTFPTNLTDPGKWTCIDSKKDYTITLDKKLEEGASKPNTDKGQEIVGETGDLTLLMIPQKLDASSTLTIKFIDALSGKERTLTASLGGNSEWKAGTRVAYSINTSGIYVDPVVDFDFQVVKPTNDTSIGGNNTPITKEQKVPTSGYIPEFKIHAYANVYQLDESSSRVDEAKVRLEIEEVSYSLNDGEWKSAGWKERNVATTSVSEDAGEYRVGSIILEPRGVFNEMRKNLYSNSVNGSADSYYDLSKEVESKEVETANCYMVNAPGYYSFPMVYGNALNSKNGNKAYYTDKNKIAEPTDEIQKTYNNPRDMVLEDFVGYNDQPVKGYSDFPYISGVKDAVLVWQDSPDLVREISVDQVGKKVRFQVDQEAINQGNAVIAVRNAEGEIMWSWHIWVTDKDWGEGNLHTCTSKYENDNAKPYILAPHNLGYCDSHDADSESRIYKLKIKVKLPDGKSKEYEFNEKSFEQYSIEASNAGDNTYYQWGRKDPILPGIWNDATIQRGKDNGSDDAQKLHYDMDNKPYYPGEYKFERVDYDFTGKTIGESIKMPYAFFMHDDPNPNIDKNIKTPDDYWKRHWHNGYKIGSKSTLMNYWDSELPDIISTASISGTGKVEMHRPTKTIYDPCPAGFCVPNGNAFTFMGQGGQYNYEKTDVTVNLKKNTNGNGWIALDDNNKAIVFPSTGLYDFGKGKEGCIEYFKRKCRPAHARLTFLSSTTFQRICQNKDHVADYYYWTGQVVITYIDDRTEYYETPKPNDVYIRINGASSNSYGCSVRPIKINW